MSKKRKVQIRNLTAKISSLFLAVVVWFLVKVLLEDRRLSGKSEEEPTILGPAVNPDLQGNGEPAKPEVEKPTVH